MTARNGRLLLMPCAKPLNEILSFCLEGPWEAAGVIQRYEDCYGLTPQLSNGGWLFCLKPFRKGFVDDVVDEVIRRGKDAAFFGKGEVIRKAATLIYWLRGMGDDKPNGHDLVEIIAKLQEDRL